MSEGNPLLGLPGYEPEPEAAPEGAPAGAQQGAPESEAVPAFELPGEPEEPQANPLAGLAGYEPKLLGDELAAYIPGTLTAHASESGAGRMGLAPPRRRIDVLPMSADVAATMGPVEAQVALENAMKLGITPDVAYRERERTAQLLSKKILPLEEIGRSRALSAFFSDPVKAAAAQDHAQDFLDLEKALRAPPLGPEIVRRGKVGLVQRRQQQLGLRHAFPGVFGSLSDAEEAEWERLKRAGPDLPPEADPGAALTHHILDGPELAAFEKIQGQLDALRPPATQLEIALGDAAEMAAGSLLPGTERGIQGATLAGVGTLAAGALGGPAGEAVALPLAIPAAFAGFGAGFIASGFEGNFAESMASFEDVRLADGSAPSPDAVRGAALLAATVKAGLDVASLAALLELSPGLAAVFKGSEATIASRLAKALSDEKTVQQLVHFALAFTEAVGVEYTTEGAQALVDRAGVERLLGKTVSEVGQILLSESALAEAHESGAMAGRATVVFGGLALGARGVFHTAGRVARARAEEKQVRQFQRIVKRLEIMGSKSPEAVREVVQGIADEQGKGTFFVEAAALPPKALAALPEATRKAVLEAASRGEPAPIPAGEWAAYVAPLIPKAAEVGEPAPKFDTQTGEALHPPATPPPLGSFSEDSVTPAEAEDMVARAGEETDARARALDHERDQARLPEADLYARNVQDALLAAGRPFEVATTGAAVMRTALLALARRENLTIAEAQAWRPGLSFGNPSQSVLPAARPDLAEAPVRDLAGMRTREETLAAVRELRSPTPRKAARRFPVLETLRRAGGVNPGSPLAAELRSMGLTARQMPGLMRKRGLGAADTLVASEHPLLANQIPLAEGTGYFTEAGILAAIREELAGRPIESEEVQVERAAREQANAELTAELEAAGIDLASVTDEEAATALLSARTTALDELFQPRAGPEVERGEAVYTVREPRADDPVRDPAPVQLALFDYQAPGAPPALAEEGAAAAGEDLVRLAGAGEVTLARIGSLRTGLTRVTLPEEVAHLTAPLRKDPQEQVLAVVTSESGDVLRVIQMSRGTSSASLVSRPEILGSAFSVPGAANLWVVHNHPSGTPNPSEQDVDLTRTLGALTERSGLVLRGSLVVAPGVGRGAVIGTMLHETREFAIEPHARVRVLDIFARRWKQVPTPPTAAIPKRADFGSMEAYSEAIRGYWHSQMPAGQTGLLFLSVRHRAIGFLPMSEDEMRVLRSNTLASGMARVASAASRLNAYAVVAQLELGPPGGVREGAREAVRNLASFAQLLFHAEPGARSLLEVLDAQSGRQFGVLPNPQATFFQPPRDRPPTRAELESMEAERAYFEGGGAEEHPSESRDLASQRRGLERVLAGAVPAADRARDTRRVEFLRMAIPEWTASRAEQRELAHSARRSGDIQQAEAHEAEATNFSSFIVSGERELAELELGLTEELRRERAAAGLQAEPQQSAFEGDWQARDLAFDLRRRLDALALDRRGLALLLETSEPGDVTTPVSREEATAELGRVDREIARLDARMAQLQGVTPEELVVGQLEARALAAVGQERQEPTAAQEASRQAHIAGIADQIQSAEGRADQAMADAGMPGFGPSGWMGQQSAEGAAVQAEAQATAIVRGTFDQWLDNVTPDRLARVLALSDPNGSYTYDTDVYPSTDEWVMSLRDTARELNQDGELAAWLGFPPPGEATMGDLAAQGFNMGDPDEARAAGFARADERRTRIEILRGRMRALSAEIVTLTAQMRGLPPDATLRIVNPPRIARLTEEADRQQEEIEDLFRWPWISPSDYSGTLPADQRFPARGMEARYRGVRVRLQRDAQGLVLRRVPDIQGHLRRERVGAEGRPPRGWAVAGAADHPVARAALESRQNQGEDSAATVASLEQELRESAENLAQDLAQRAIDEARGDVEVGLEAARTALAEALERAEDSGAEYRAVELAHEGVLERGGLGDRALTVRGEMNAARRNALAMEDLEQSLRLQLEAVERMTPADFGVLARYRGVRVQAEGFAANPENAAQVIAQLEIDRAGGNVDNGLANARAGIRRNIDYAEEEADRFRGVEQAEQTTIGLRPMIGPSAEQRNAAEEAALQERNAETSRRVLAALEAMTPADFEQRAPGVPTEPGLTLADRVLANRATSYWLRDALASALERPSRVAAIEDARTLVAALERDPPALHEMARAWLHIAFDAAVLRDPVDALRDAETLLVALDWSQPTGRTFEQPARPGDLPPPPRPTREQIPPDYQYPEPYRSLTREEVLIEVVSSLSPVLERNSEAIRASVPSFRPHPVSPGYFLIDRAELGPWLEVTERLGIAAWTDAQLFLQPVRSTPEDLAEIAELKAKIAALSDRLAGMDSRNPSLRYFEIDEEIQNAEDRLAELEEGRPTDQSRQGPPEAPRGSIEFDPAMRSAVVSFLTAPDHSTLFHELGHYYTLSLLHQASQPNAPAWLVRDAEILRSFAGATPGIDLTTAQAEKLAEAFVVYLRTGRAPSRELRSAFARMRQWFVELYQTVRELIGEDALPADVAGVFDRLLATDQEIAEVRGDELGGSIFAAGDLSEQERLAIEEAMAASAGDTRSQIDRLQLRELARRTGIFEKVARDRERILAATRATIREQVALDVERDRAWRADHYLRTGQFLGMATPEGTPAYKISRPSILELFGPESAAGKAILAVPTGARSWLSVTKGVHPDELCEQLGYDTGAELVRALLAIGSREAGSRERVIEEITKERMKAVGKLAAGELENAAKIAFRTESRMELQRIEDQILSERTGNPTVEGLDKRADIIISQKEHRALRPDVHRSIARKSRRLALLATREGDFVKAQVHLRRGFLHELLEVKARERMVRDEQILAQARVYERSPKVRKKIGLAGHGYLAQIDSILELVELRVIPIVEAHRRAQEFFAWLAERELEGDEIVVPDWMRSRGQRPWRTLTGPEFEGLGAVLDSLANAARQQRVMLLGEELVERETVARGMIAEMRPLRKATRSARLTPHRMTVRSVLKALVHRDPEQLGDLLWSTFRRLDSWAVGKEGFISSIVASDVTSWMFKALIQPFVDAANWKADYMDKVVIPIRAMADEYMRRHQKLYDELLPGETRLFNKWQKKPMELTRRDILGIALNTGSVSQLEKLMGGYGWWDLSDEDFEPAARRLMEVVEDHMTDEDWHLVAQLWDLLEAQWPLIEAHEQKMTGVAPVRVEPREFVTRSGIKMRGGYFPVVYDPTRSERSAQLLAERNAKERPGGFGPVETRHSFTKARTGLKTRAVKIEAWEVLLQHIEDVAHDLAYREPIVSTSKLLARTDLQEAWTEHFGAEFGVTQFFTPWLRAIGRDVTEPGMAEANRILRGLRSRATAFVLLARPRTILVQPSGILNGLQGVAELVKGQKVGTGARHVIAAKYMADGIWQSLGRGSWKESQRLYAWAMASSAVLRHRMETYDRDLRDLARELAGKHGWDDRTLTFFRHAIAGMQLLAVDLPTWHAAYRLSKDEGLSDADAIATADSTVKTSQGSGDLVANARYLVETSEVTKGLFTFLGTYLGAQLNQVRGSWRRHHSVPATAAALVTAVWWPALLSLGIGTLLNALYNSLFPGSAPPPPEDEEAWRVKIGQTIASSVLDLFPVIREYEGAVLYGHEPGLPGTLRVWGDAVLDVSRGIRAGMARGEYGQLVVGLAELTGISKGLPLGWPSEVTGRVVQEEAKQERETATTRARRRGTSKRRGD